MEPVTSNNNSNQVGTPVNMNSPTPGISVNSNINSHSMTSNNHPNNNQQPASAVRSPIGNPVNHQLSSNPNIPPSGQNLSAQHRQRILLQQRVLQQQKQQRALQSYENQFFHLLNTVNEKPKRLYNFVEESDHILKKYEQYRPSFEFHIYENNYKICAPANTRVQQQQKSPEINSDGLILNKNNDTLKEFLEFVARGRIPEAIMEVLRDSNIQFYEGNLILQVYDHTNTVDIILAQPNSSANARINTNNNSNNSNNNSTASSNSTSNSNNNNNNSNNNNNNNNTNSNTNNIGNNTGNNNSSINDNNTPTQTSNALSQASQTNSTHNTNNKLDNNSNSSTPSNTDYITENSKINSTSTKKLLDNDIKSPDSELSSSNVDATVALSKNTPKHATDNVSSEKSPIPGTTSKSPQPAKVTMPSTFKRPRVYRTLLRPNDLTNYYDMMSYADYTRFSDAIYQQLEAEILSLTKRNLSLDVPMNPYQYKNLLDPHSFSEPTWNEDKKCLKHNHRELSTRPGSKDVVGHVEQHEEFAQHTSNYEQMMLILNERTTTSTNSTFTVAFTKQALQNPLNGDKYNKGNANSIDNEDSGNDVNTDGSDGQIALAAAAAAAAVNANIGNDNNQFSRLKFIEQWRLNKEKSKQQSYGNSQAQPPRSFNSTISMSNSFTSQQQQIMEQQQGQRQQNYSQNQGQQNQLQQQLQQQQLQQQLQLQQQSQSKGQVKVGVKRGGSSNSTSNPKPKNQENLQKRWTLMHQRRNANQRRNKLQHNHKFLHLIYLS
ncbi:hypothetical protein TBLA_0I00130 [Henningerozyma blattae CBS 6284]|uniref:Spt20-like SEP domain-containing protein n=1 Tax=Henningerozyma blattae (strain ATCC 34711 / CBS 6284 / DSM 70876 / NBRC 10599 / NRRL Y-10934 / UCD 77-7) TaxID=1071380 RepID=I2H8H6_HENB6|nr:hypothetical protein TBLA_0I00130 [Tetrapisispora blattae CBS 6284]CCH62678.1 hypothetical protein TBLA_0I00130 [Tetrapisispora blattae CBS 6284]